VVTRDREIVTSIPGSCSEGTRSNSLSKLFRVWVNSVMERSGLVNEQSILAAKIVVSILIFLAPKMSAVYRPN